MNVYRIKPMMEVEMARIKYPDDWLGAESLALIINYAELTKFCKANGLNSGHISYLIRNIQDSVSSTTNRMLEEAKPNATLSNLEGRDGDSK